MQQSPSYACGADDVPPIGGNVHSAYTKSDERVTQRDAGLRPQPASDLGLAD